MQSPWPVTQIAVNISTATDTTLVAAPTLNKRIVVTGYTLIAGGTGNFTWKSGSTSKSGPLNLAAQAGAANAFHPDGVIICNAGEALVATTSAAVQISGHITYEIRD